MHESTKLSVLKNKYWSIFNYKPSITAYCIAAFHRTKISLSQTITSRGDFPALGGDPAGLISRLAWVSARMRVCTRLSIFLFLKIPILFLFLSVMIRWNTCYIYIPLILIFNTYLTLVSRKHVHQWLKNTSIYSSLNSLHNFSTLFISPFPLIYFLCTGVYRCKGVYTRSDVTDFSPVVAIAEARLPACSMYSIYHLLCS